MNLESTYGDGSYLERHPTWHAEDSAWKSRQINELFRRNGLSPSTVCEIGCGAGEILHCLAAELGDKVTFFGYEISPQAFALTNTREKRNIHFRLGDLLADQSSESFDLAMAIDVFEHVEDCFAFLRAFRSKARYKVFHIPLDLSVQSVLRASPIMNARAVDGHIHYFTKETALATLVDTGYEVIDFSFTSWSLELPAHSFKGRLARLPRRILRSINPDLAARLLGGFSLLVLAR